MQFANPNSAKELVEMNECKCGGAICADYFRNRPALGKIKLTDFALDFAHEFIT